LVSTDLAVAVAELAHELLGRRGRAHVVPELSRTDHATLVVERHQPVLLAADGERLDVLHTSGRGDRRLQGFPPGRWVDFCPRRVRR
jgi:hypothetical protein